MARANANVSKSLYLSDESVAALFARGGNGRLRRPRHRTDWLPVHCQSQQQKLS